MVIPRISSTNRYILSQLEEIERDDNFRLKRFKELKTKKKQKDSIDTHKMEKESKMDVLKELVDLEMEGVNEDSMQQKNNDKYEQDEIHEKCSCSQNFQAGEYKEIREPNVDLLKHSKNNVQDIMSHADEIINLSKRNDICDSKVLAVNDELQAILDKLVNDRLCEYCKKGTQVKDIKNIHRTHSSHNNLSNSSKFGSELSIPDSIFSMKTEDKGNLGHFKRKYKESIEVLRLQNEDGTIRQKKKKVIVKTDTRNPIKAKGSEDCAKHNLYCPCFKFDSESEDSSEDSNDPKNKSRYRENSKKKIHCTMSGPAFGSSFRNEAKLRQSMSSEQTCLCPSVNLTVQSVSSNRLQNFSINWLPLISSMNQACNIANANEAAGNIDFTKTVDISYILKNVLNTTNKQNLYYLAFEKSCLELPKFAYIFSKVNKASNDEGFLKSCFDILSTGSYSYTNLYSSYKRTEIDSLVRKACFHVINFPYLFNRCTSGSVKNVTKVDAATCCCPGDITVQLKLQGKNSGMLHVIKVTELPLVSSVNVNVFCSARNIFQEPMVENYNCLDSNGIIKNKVHNNSEIAPNQLGISKETTDTFTSNLDPISTPDELLNKSNRAFNEEKTTIQALTDCGPCEISGMNNMLNHINPSCNDKQRTTSQKMPKLAYIFSKINGVYDNAENSSRTINIILKGFYNSSTKFPYIFSSYKRVEIENLLNNACSNVVSFPYLFTKITNKQESNKNCLKLTNFKLMFNDENKQISNNFIKIDDISEYERLDNKGEDQKSNALVKEESKNQILTERCCRNSSYTKCNFNPSFDKICKDKDQNYLSYIFSKVKSSSSSREFNLSKHVNIIEKECSLDNTKDNSAIPTNGLFRNSKGDHKIIKNISTLQCVEENIDVRRYVPYNFSYIFSKLSGSESPTNYLNDYPIDVLFKDASINKHDFPYLFNKLENMNFTSNLNPIDFIRHQDIDKLFKECCKRKSVISNDFKYILEKVELNNNKKDEFVYIFSKVKELSKTFNKQKCPNDDNIDSSKLKYDCVSYRTRAFPYIFNKVHKGSSFTCASSYTEIDAMFKDACKSINDFSYSKNLQPSLYREIAKLFNDSCKIDVDLKHKYEYLFDKVHDLDNKQTKQFCGNCKNTKVSIQRPTLSCHSFIDYNKKSLNIISNQSQGVLVKFLSYKSGSCFGIELRLGADCASINNSLNDRAATSKSLISLKSCSSFNMANKKDVEIVISKMLHNQENSNNVALIDAEEESIKGQEKLSSITRMLNTVKNSYAPLGPSITVQDTDKYLSIMDNIKSILPNSTVSSYSWKSCVMKTCQAEIENTEKNISYSTFSFESSLDYVSCKSEDRVSDNRRSKVKGNINLNRDPISLNVEMALGGSIYNMYSHLSTREENSSTTIFKTSLNSLYKSLSLSDVHINEISEVHCGNALDFLDRPNRYFRLKQECSNSCCSHSEQFSKPTRQDNQSNIEYYCNICKQRNLDSANYFNDPTQCSSNRSVQKFQWLHRDNCGCFKKPK